MELLYAHENHHDCALDQEEWNTLNRAFVARLIVLFALLGFLFLVFTPFLAPIPEPLGHPLVAWAAIIAIAADLLQIYDYLSSRDVAQLLPPDASFIEPKNIPSESRKKLQRVESSAARMEVQLSKLITQQDAMRTPKGKSAVGRKISTMINKIIILLEHGRSIALQHSNQLLAKSYSKRIDKKESVKKRKTIDDEEPSRVYYTNSLVRFIPGSMITESKRGYWKIENTLRNILTYYEKERKRESSREDFKPSATVLALVVERLDDVRMHGGLCDSYHENLANQTAKMVDDAGALFFHPKSGLELRAHVAKVREIFSRKSTERTLDDLL